MRYFSRRIKTVRSDRFYLHLSGTTVSHFNEPELLERDSAPLIALLEPDNESSLALLDLRKF